jgi:peptidoglycan/LPS O-acetylase OafA/YrhL
MKRTRKYLGIIVLYLISLGLLLFTNPQHTRPVFLIVPLLIFFAAIFLTLMTMLSGFARRRGRRPSRNSVIAAAIITALPVILILLQSIGQLSTRDVITLVLIILILGIYVSKIGIWRAKS